MKAFLLKRTVGLQPGTLLKGDFAEYLRGVASEYVQFTYLQQLFICRKTVQKAGISRTLSNI